MEIIAHRAARNGPRRPSSAAVLGQTLRGPADRVELDILCLDGRLVVAHDPGEARLPGRLTLDSALGIVAASGRGLLADIKGRGTAELLGHTLVVAGLAGRTIVCGELAEVELACNGSGATRAWTLPAARASRPPSTIRPCRQPAAPALPVAPALPAGAVLPAAALPAGAVLPAAAVLPASPVLPADAVLRAASTLWTARSPPAPAPPAAPAPPPAPAPPAHPGLLGRASRRGRRRVEAAAVAGLESGRCDVVCVDRRFVAASLVDAVHRHGGRLLAWTVDDPADAQRLAALGVDGVITNEPDQLAACLSGRSAQWSDG
jgi:glycerophosphoryl diester phosphodiesterase